MRPQPAPCQLLLLLLLLLLLWLCRLRCCRGLRLDSGVWPDEFFIAQAQATAYCVKTMLHAAAGSQGKNETRLQSCRRLTVCRECLNGAMLDPRDNCQRACQGKRSCEMGCSQLQNMAKNRRGSCPTATEVKDPCKRRTCDDDRDCLYSSGDKCCYVGDCKLCKPAQRKLHLPTPKLHLSDKSLLVQYNSSGSQVVIFVVQGRSLIGPEFNEHLASQWSNLTITMAPRLQLEDMRRGYLLQLRVAAVTERGSNGFGQPSHPLKHPEPPRPPQMPRDIRQEKTLLESATKFSVLITWARPLYSDLPITSYEVKWRWRWQSEEGQNSETVYKKRVPPNSLKCKIDQLEPGRSYKIEVRAESKYGDTALISEATQLYVKLPKGHRSRTSQDAPSAAECERGKRRVTFADPLFANGSAQIKALILGPAGSGRRRPAYLVECQRRVCISDDDRPAAQGSSGCQPITIAPSGYFTLKNLHLNCIYSLRITPLNSTSDDGWRPEPITACFRMPSCSEIRVAANSRRPLCPALPVSLPEPRKLQVRLLGEQPDGSLSYRVHWLAPATSAFGSFADRGSSGSSQLARYSIVWGPRVNESVSWRLYGRQGLYPQLDTSRAVSRVLPASNTSLDISGLRSGQLYIVLLRSIAIVNRRFLTSQQQAYFFVTVDSRRQATQREVLEEEGAVAYRYPNFAEGEISKYVRIGANCQRSSVAMTAAALATAAAAAILAGDFVNR